MSSQKSSEDAEESAEKRRRQRRAQILLVVVAGAQCLAVEWTNMTEAQRQLVRMRIWSSLEKTMAGLARRVGAQGMRAELEGRRPAYELSHFCSVLRDAARARYERVRTA